MAPLASARKPLWGRTSGGMEAGGEGGGVTRMDWESSSAALKWETGRKLFTLMVLFCNI